MATATDPARPPAPYPFSPMAGVLSYLVPGLGQIAQGRVAKGLLFLICIYTLFFYGAYLGAGTVTVDGKTYKVSSNVYLPDTTDENPRPADRPMPALAQNLYNRPQFAGQFWVGVAAWPAIIQYMKFDRRETARIEAELEDLRGSVEANRLADPEESQRKQRELEEREKDPRRKHPVLGEYMREPSGAAINAIHNAGDKRLELAWVYTVIAGVLNILVIYDAVAGPAFGQPATPEPKKE